MSPLGFEPKRTGPKPAMLSITSRAREHDYPTFVFNTCCSPSIPAGVIQIIKNSSVTYLIMRLKYDRRDVKSWAKSPIPFIWEKRIMIAFIILAVIFTFFFWTFVKTLLVMGVFIVIGVASLMYNRWVKVSLGFELIMFGVVITGMLYGSVEALVVGFVALFFAEVLTNRFNHATFVSFIGMFAVAMVVPSFEGDPVRWVGIGMTLLYDAIILPGYLILGSSPGRSFLFLGTHLMFNFWIFWTVAPVVMPILD